MTNNKWLAPVLVGVGLIVLIGIGYSVQRYRQQKAAGDFLKSMGVSGNLAEEIAKNAANYNNSSGGNPYEALEEMCEHVKGLLTKLELPFRMVLLCGGDMGFTSAMTYDMEVWSGAQKRWLEVSSISNFEIFQSNRMKLRFKDGAGKIHLAHTLNGSALALPRIVAALLENNQRADGIKMPLSLVPYAGFDFIR